MNKENLILKVGLNVIEDELAQLKNIASRLDSSFVKAVEIMIGCKGKIVLIGLGKTGHIARKIAATLASTGSPAFFVHAAEAAHGDLGMISKNDVVVAISYSGSSDEILKIVPSIKQEKICLISITGSDDNLLAKQSDVNLNIHVDKEACVLNLAPTASSTAALVLGDALAVACMNERDFSKVDFAKRHPGGALGRKLLVFVRDLMRKGKELPQVFLNVEIMEAVKEIGKKNIGMTCVVDKFGNIEGVFTDGDLRRLIQKKGDIRGLGIAEVMTGDPICIKENDLAENALKKMKEHSINQLIVLDSNEKLVGAIHVQDLIQAKLY